MKRQVSMTEIENFIKEKIHEKGVSDMIGEDKISEIKEKIRSIIKSKKLEEADAAPATAPQKPEQPQTKQNVQNPNITLKTTEDPERSSIAKKEAELELRQQELSKKEAELKERERILMAKENELSYKPELPDALANLQPGEFIVFSENELSAGMESLSERKFRLKSNPDEKHSPHELWMNDAITKSNVFLVELKPIGALVFDPYQGTTTFSNEPIVASEPQSAFDDSEGESRMTPLESQIPEEGLVDMVEPIKNVTQPIANPGPPEPAQSIETTDFKEMIEKIVKDQLSRKSNYSLGPGPAGQGVY